MPSPDPGAGRLTRPPYLFAVACVLAAYALTTASHFTQGELSLDDASTFFVAVRPLVDIPAVAISFHSQPPLFYFALHAWSRIGDTEAALRALPMIFMVCAAVTLLCTRWLPRLTRAVATALLLLTPYSGFLTSALRPYSLSVWLSLWSCLLFMALLLGLRRRAVSYAGYVVVTALMAYSVAMTSWILLAQGLCAVAVYGVAAGREGLRRALVQQAGLFLSLAAVAMIYLPYVIAVWRVQGHLAHPAIAATLAATTNPRYFVSGPMYLLAMPGGLGYLALAAAAFAMWSGVRRHDPATGVLTAIVLLQIALTHGFLEGRSPFGFRYLAPAYPALCLLAGLGAGRVFSRVRAAGIGVTACAAGVLVAALVAFVRTPHAPPAGLWRQVRADLLRLPGTKMVFFDIGWDAQRLQYEVRDDPDVRIMSDAGSGWDTGGRMMTAEYVARTIDRNVGPGTMFFYEFDPVINTRAFDEAFAPGMLRHRCVRVYQRDVPTYARASPGDAGALLYGYACHGV